MQSSEHSSLSTALVIDPVDVKSFKYNNSNNNDLYYRLASSASCAGK